LEGCGCFCNIIEAPWLVNGGHSASLSLPLVDRNAPPEEAGVGRVEGNLAGHLTGRFWLGFRVSIFPTPSIWLDKNRPKNTTETTGVAQLNLSQTPAPAPRLTASAQTPHSRRSAARGRRSAPATHGHLIEALWIPNPLPVADQWRARRLNEMPLDAPPREGTGRSAAPPPPRDRRRRPLHGAPSTPNRYVSSRGGCANR
jgi:hypothetical protein